jgi:predicted transcriptional regulator
MAEPLTSLSRRERQIMEIIYTRGQATVAEVREDLLDPPSYSAVRAAVRVLGEKGHLLHESDGPRYVFRPTHPRERVRTSALKRVLTTFFGGRPEDAVAALLEENELSPDQLDRVSHLIEEHRKKEGLS